MTKRERIIQLLPTLNDAMIAREAGVSREWVRQVRKDEGIQADEAKHIFCSQLTDEAYVSKLIKLSKTMTVSAIAKTLGRPEHNVRDACKRLGIKPLSYREYLDNLIRKNWTGDIRGTAKLIGLSYSCLTQESLRLGLRKKKTSLSVKRGTAYSLFKSNWNGSIKETAKLCGISIPHAYVLSRRMRKEAKCQSLD